MASSADIQAQIDDLNNKISKLSGGLSGAAQRTTYEAQIQRLQPQLNAARQAEAQQAQQQQQQQEQQQQQQQQQQQPPQQEPPQQQAAPLSQAAPAANNSQFPTLNQSIIDEQYKNRRTNDLTSFNSDIRDQLYNAGWNQKSDAVRVLNGAGVYGLVSTPTGMGGTGYQTVNGSVANDQDFINAAKAAGVDPNQYVSTSRNMGQTTTTLNRAALYNAINDKSKDLYSVTNALTGAPRGELAPHATVLYKADGNGNLVAQNNAETGQPDVKYFNATRYAKAPSFFEEYGPFLALLPAVGGVLQHANVLGSLGGASGAAALDAGQVAANTGVNYFPGVEAGAGHIMAGYTGAPLNSLGVSAGLGGAGYLGADTMDNIIANAIADTYNPNAPAYEIGSEGPAQIGTQQFPQNPNIGGSSGVLSGLKNAKNLLSAGKSIAGLLGADPTGLNGSGGGLGGSSTPTFLDSTPEFLNKSRNIAPYSGLKTVNKEAEKEIAPLDIEPTTTSSEPTMSTFKIGGLAGGGGDFAQIIKDMTPAGLCETSTKKTFSTICDKPEYLYSSKSKTHVPLKALRQTKVNPLATGGLPHKYAAAAPKGHKPEFITGMTGYYACGKGTGQSDDIPAMLHDGDYVMDAETVSALGDGSSKAGKEVLEGFREKIPHMKEGGGNPVPAKIADGEYVFPAAFVTSLGGGDNKRGAEILDGLRTKLRAHKRGAPLNKIPPKAKDPIEYIKTGSK